MENTMCLKNVGSESCVPKDSPLAGSPLRALVPGVGALTVAEDPLPRLAEPGREWAPSRSVLIMTRWLEDDMFLLPSRWNAGALPQVLSRRQSGGSDSVGCHPAHSLQPPPETLELVLLPPTRSAFPAEPQAWNGEDLPQAPQLESAPPSPQPSCLPSQVRRPDPGSPNALHISTHSTWRVVCLLQRTEDGANLMALLPAHCCTPRLTNSQQPEHRLSQFLCRELCQLPGAGDHGPRPHLPCLLSCLHPLLCLHGTLFISRMADMPLRVHHQHG